MGPPEFAAYAALDPCSGHKGSNVFAPSSEFDSTLEKLSPQLLARLSLNPGGCGSPGTPCSSCSGPGTPSETASSGGHRSSDGHRHQNRRRGNRSWATQPPLPERVTPPGLTPPSRSSLGSLPSPPYSAEVDRAFRHTHIPQKPFGRPRSAESTPGGTPNRAQHRPTHMSPPCTQHWDHPGSHSRGPAPRRQPPRGGHPRKLQLSEAGQRLLRAGQRAGQPPRAGSDAGSTEGSPSQPRPPSPASAGGAARSRARESTSGSDPDDETDALAAGKQSTTASPRAVHRSTGLQAADEPAELQPAPGADATCSDEEDLPAEEGDDEAQKRLERLQAEKELADGAAAQMAAQAQALVAERAEMAARNAALARENAQLLARLEFLEASVAATADDDNANGDGEQQQQLAEELGFLHDMLQRSEDEKVMLEWQLQQRAVAASEHPEACS